MPKKISRAEKRPILAAGLALLLALLPRVAPAAAPYWIGGAGSWDTTTTNWTSDSSLAGPFEAWGSSTANPAIFSGTAGTVTLSGPLSAKSLEFNTTGYTLTGSTLTLAAAGTITSTTGNQTLSSILAGSGTSLTKSGAGNITLTKANTYTGSTVISGGTLTVSGSGATIGIAGTASTATISSGKLSIENAGSVKNTTATLGSASGTTGSVKVDGTGSLWTLSATSSNVLTIASGGNADIALTAGGKITATRPIVLSPTATHTADLLIDGTNSTLTALNFTLAGAGTNTATISNGGKLAPTGSITLGGAGTTSFTVESGGKVTGNLISIGTPTAGGARVTDVTITGAGSSWVGSGTSFLNMDGNSTLTLADGALYSTGGGIIIGASADAVATVNLGGAGTTYTGGTSAGIIVGSVGSGVLNINDGAILNAQNLLRLGNTAATSSAVINQNGGTVTVTRSLEFIAGTKLEYHLSGGTLIVGDAFGTGVNLATPTTYLFELGGGTLQVKGNSSSQLTVRTDLTLKSGTTSTLSTPSGGLQTMYLLGGVSGAGNLAVSGGGTVRIDHATTYTGTTTISAGTLKLNTGGTLSGSSLIQVASGATFDVAAVTGGFTLGSGQTIGGTGSITGGFTLGSGAHIAPGNSPGTITFNSGLKLTSGSYLDFQLGTANDLIDVKGGALTGPFTGTIIVNVSDSGGFGAGTYDLIHYPTLADGSATAANFTLGTSIPGYTYRFALGNGALQLIATAIPEPAVISLFFALAALSAGLLRRRVKL